MIDEPRSSATGTLRHVLVADDEPLVADFVGRVVTRLGFTVTTAHDGEAAIAAVMTRQASFVCAILDVAMPVVHGVDVACVLRQHAPQIPLIFMSGYVPPHLFPRIEQLGNVQLLSKPFTGEQLSQVLRALT